MPFITSSPFYLFSFLYRPIINFHARPKTENQPKIIHSSHTCACLCFFGQIKAPLTHTLKEYFKMGKKGKSSGSGAKKQAKKEAKNLNAQNLASLNRLAKALTELDTSSSSTFDKEGSSTNSTCKSKGSVVGLPLNHWKELPENVTQAYKMLSDGAEVIKATSTKYTLLGKINLEDGSKYAVRISSCIHY
jgi:hypothetical protein